jgi:hypothetical protein
LLVVRGGLASLVVKPLTEPEIRAAFVNCSKGEAKRASIPRDLACSLYIRGKKAVQGLGGRPPERLTLEEKAERTMANLAAFIAKVTG